MDGLRLADLRKPLGAVTFLSGTVIVPVPFGPAEYALWRELQRETDPQKVGQMGFAIIRACYPGVTDEDLLDCDPHMLLELAAYPGGKIEQVRAALKNAEAVAAEQGGQPPPSSPTTSGSTSASKSRKRSGKTSGTSTSASPTDAPSSSGTATTGSTSRSGSTNSGASSTTSTAPPSLPAP